jgi:nitroreductase
MDLETDISARDAMKFNVEIRDAVDAAILSRRSVRQFLPTPIPLETVMEILDIAARSPSGHNTQAWRVHLLQGNAKDALTSRILTEFEEPDALVKHRPEFDSYPAEWVNPYIERRRKVGRDMYTLLGIARGDTRGMHAQLARNFAFFGAPVGFIFTLQKVMIPGSAMDLGMFLQSIMIAARARGIATCPQAAFATFHRVIVDQLGIESDHVVMCGMSMGYEDISAIVNKVVTDRVPASSFTRLHH